MKYLLAFDKYKGSMTAPEVCEVVAKGIHAVNPNAEVTSCPISDGGEGFTLSMVSALGGRIIDVEVDDPLGRPVNAYYGLIDRAPSEGGSLAVMEMATASGLMLLTHPDSSRGLDAIERDNLKPLEASSRGTGQLMRHAIEESKVQEIIMGIGGSATNDAGFGMLQALGLKGFDKDGNEVSGNPKGLLELDRLDDSELIETPKLTIACDVENPLFGDTGATRIFGKQKGVNPEAYDDFEKALAKLAYISKHYKLIHEKGAGAAGGLGFSLLAFFGAELTGGFELIAKTLGIEEKIKNSDVVITGEGSMDEQTLSGKGPAGIAQMTRDAGKITAAIAGKIEPIVANYGLFDHCLELITFDYPLEEVIRRAPELTQQRASELATTLEAQ